MNSPFPRWLTALFTATVLALVGAGIWFYHSQHQIAQRNVEANLEAIAQLKVDQIVQWRDERLADAAQLMESPFLTGAVAKWLERPEPALTADLLTRFRVASKHSNYGDVTLIDTNGQVRLSLSGRRGPLHPEVMQSLAIALRDRKPVLSELNAGPGDLPPHLYVVAPLVVSNADAARPCGVILLQCDARKFLYALIQSWPLPSASADTLLVRRDGNAALYVSKLRHQAETALNLRVPLTKTNAVAVMAVLGQKGIVQGRDYRGVNSVSVIKAIPGSKWFLVAKVDKAEAFAAWHFRSVLILALIFGFTIAAAAIAGLVWQRTTKHYRYTRNLIEASLDPLVAINPELRILDANAATEKAIGRSRPELIGTDFAMYFTDPPKTRSSAEQAFRTGTVRNLLLELCQRDGQAASVLCNMSLYRGEWGRTRCALAAIRDITERQRMDAAFRRVHRAYRIISACNQLLVRAGDEFELLNEVCRLIVEDGGFCFAWVGFAEEDPARTVKPVTYSGHEAGYLSAVSITWGEDEHGRGPTGTAIRTGNVAVCRNTLTDPNFSPWRDEALKRGYTSSIVLPLLDQGRAFGALSIYATEMDAFATEEVQLLTQLASDLAYGITSLRVRFKHQEAEAEIRKLNVELEERVRERTRELAESEERLRLVLQAGLTGTFEVDFQTGKGRWNDIEYALLGLKPGAVPPVPESFFRFVHPDDVKALRGQWEEALHAGRLDAEFRIVRADGQVRWLAGKGQLVSQTRAGENGEMPGRWRGQFLGVNYDISDRKHAQETLDRNYRRTEFLAEAARLLLASTDPRQIVEDICRKVVERLDGHVFFNYLVDASSGRLHLFSYAGIPEEKMRRIEWLDRSTSICGAVVEQHQSIVAGDVQASTDARTHLVRTLGIQAYACHPLIIREQVYGTLLFGTRSRKQFDDDDLLLMRAVAHLIAIALYRRELEETLRANEERFRVITTNTPDHLLVQDHDLRYTFVVNPQLGLTERDMLGKTDRDFLPPEDADRLIQIKRTVLETGQPVHVEAPLTSRNGERRIFDGSYIPKLNGHGKVDGLIGYFRDVTERKRTEEEIQKLNEQLQQRAIQLEAANKELESFSYSVSHDLRAPLRAIDGFSQVVLEDYADQLDAKGRENLGRIRTATVRMGELIDDLLKLSRITRGELHVSRVVLSALAATVVDDLRRTDADRAVEFIIASGLAADGDAHLIRIVLENLLGNAWKFTAKQPAARIEFGAVPHEGASAYFVRDNGVGFDMTYASKLFGAFQRLHTTAEFPGTGIGLATVRRIIHRHGGRVWAESKPGQETTFYFTLPNQPKEAEP